MARTIILVPLTWTKIASGSVLITVKKSGRGVLLFNETPETTNAYTCRGPAGDQFQQTEFKDTYVRATRLGWRILVDGEL